MCVNPSMKETWDKADKGRALLKRNASRTQQWAAATMEGWSFAGTSPKVGGHLPAGLALGTGSSGFHSALCDPAPGHVWLV